MSSGDTSPMPDGGEPADRAGRFGLRLAIWYATLFIASSFTIVLLTYWLTSSSLAQRDHEIIQQKLDEYATVYARGGLRALTARVDAEQRTSRERIFVRVLEGDAETVLLSNAEGWDVSALEVGTVSLLDGSLVQVGKSTEARNDILARLRAVLGFVTLAIVAVALTGGWVATQSAVLPIRRLSAAVRRIIATGRTDERVPVSGDDDAVNELTQLFNQMLDRIEGLVRGMRGALDNVSHDLRTPLTRLRGTSELALAAAPDLDRYREALADAVEESDRVLVMLNTLMDISEAESGAMPLTRERFDLRDAAERAIELYRDVSDSRDIRIEHGVWTAAFVLADRVRLEQVAANLIDNAVKYTPEDGRVTVGVTIDGGWAVLTVRDTGIGIPESEQARIWERLFRGDLSRTARGLGLGLSLVKAIVEAHGGSVDVSSESGQGSTFTVRLPVA